MSIGQAYLFVQSFLARNYWPEDYWSNSTGSHIIVNERSSNIKFVPNLVLMLVVTVLVYFGLDSSLGRSVACSLHDLFGKALEAFEAEKASLTDPLQEGLEART